MSAGPPSSRVLARKPRRIAGAVLLAQRRVMDRLAGEATVRRALERLPIEMREEYESIGLFSWCTQATAREVTAAVAFEAGRSPAKFVAEVVRNGVVSTFRGPWKVLLGVTGDEALVKRAALFYSKACDGGACEAELVAPGRGRVRLFWEDPHDLDVISFAVGIEAILHVAGRTKARVTWTVSPTGVEYDVLTA
jgi:hypothetical protein